MDIISSLSILALAGLIHASFQLSVSVLSLVNGHALGSKHSQERVLRLSTSFVIGATVMTLLLLSTLSLILLNIFVYEIPAIAWSAVSGLMFSVGVAVWIFYYRRTEGTSTWVPRPVAAYLTDRTKSTKSSIEAFALGMVSIFGELIFIIAPLLAASMVIINMPTSWQLAGIATYTIFSILSLVIVWVSIGSGHKVSKIQKWREQNKYFLQFIAGGGLIVMCFYLYTYEVLSSAVLIGGY